MCKWPGIEDFVLMLSMKFVMWVSFEFTTNSDTSALEINDSVILLVIVINGSEMSWSTNRALEQPEQFQFYSISSNFSSIILYFFLMSKSMCSLDLFIVAVVWKRGHLKGITDLKRNFFGTTCIFDTFVIRYVQCYTTPQYTWASPPSYIQCIMCFTAYDVKCVLGVVSGGIWRGRGCWRGYTGGTLHLAVIKIWRVYCT